MIKWSTAGESHGSALLALIEGMPAGVEIESTKISRELERRRLGYGRGSRQKFEADRIELISGIRHGKTLGSPISVLIHNSEWPKWKTVMSADPVDPAALQIDAGVGDTREIARNRKLTKPRPGHADLVGMNKYGFTDARNVLERASARETAARVALGAIAKEYLRQVAHIEIGSQVLQVGSVSGPESLRGNFTPDNFSDLDASPVRTLDLDLENRFIAEIDAAKKAGDTLGGVVEIVAFNVPQALGTYTIAAERLDAQIAAAMMSIQAVKGVEIGDGFRSAGRRGSAAHDEIFPASAENSDTLFRKTNRAGGIEGGMSNGEPVVVRLAYKPISTVPHALSTIDTETGQAATALHQRSDTTAVIPGAVIGESMLALVLARALNSQIGGDSMRQAKENLHSFINSIPQERR
ncbi:chorismate synthase [Arcanobacterium hippocoleae]|uniref:Chorismate synthase n=1 Tax=Arcanobacterium hippocoleae TaxID=149017 RepID=A0ABU1T050_9ACTO|nr:chorismate synthase [Arcanobacterium hippocoleae]MDR6938752.1 chorismate synthase [Arcanobacterium hippocoleae]